MSYSGLGFGGSGCDIHLDDRDWDGKAAQDLVTYLAALDYVKKDAPGDPRLGMIGGSYGGQVQFAVAAIDKRVDTIVPIITWHDLAYSLAPNNLALGAHPTGTPPGVPKWEWTELFFGVGASQPVQNWGTTPFPPSTCPGFDPAVCPANATTATLGYPTADTIALLRKASVATYLDDIEIPTLLAQGQGDTLFNLNEAVATYEGLKARGVPVKLMFQSWGHSDSSPAPGELNLREPVGTHQGEVFAAWFDKHLKDADVDTGAEFEFFRPWVTYEGSAAPAYGSAPRYPLKDTLPLRLSGSNALAGPGSVVAPGSATFAAPPGGEPASYSETSAVQTQEPFASIPPTDPPGTFAAFSTPVLTGDVDVVGIPTLDVTLSTPASTYANPGVSPTLYAKLYDVAPNGSVELVHRIVSPVRLGTANQKVRIHLPGIVHRFAEGHVLRLVLATTDQAYLSSRAAHVITVTNDPAAPHVLTLPVTSKKAAASVPRVLGERTAAGPTVPGSGTGGTGGTAPREAGRNLAATGLGDAVAPLALAAAAAAAWLRRRRTTGA